MYKPEDLVQAINLVCSWVDACQGHEPSQIMVDGEDRAEATVVQYALKKWRDRFIAVFHPELAGGDDHE